jgi:hypothetical protein
VPDELYSPFVPVGGHYAFDLMVEVGLARYRDHRQDAEIQRVLQQRWNLSLPASSIGLLSQSFLDGLAAVHQAHAVELRERLAADGGYTLHLDGTCEAGTDIAFAAVAGPRGWTLETAKIPSENVEAIRQVIERAVTRFGTPRAVMRDLSPNIDAKLPERQLSTLHTIARHLAKLREDPEIVAAAARPRLEKASRLFEELRGVLRLNHPADGAALRGRLSREDRRTIETVDRSPKSWHQRLQARQASESDEELRHDQQVVLEYLQKYEHELTGHTLPGFGRTPFVAPRTNNVPEHLFGRTKRGVRRKVGTKKLTRYMQSMRAEELLVANLSDRTYVEIICAGDLTWLGDEIARHWGAARQIQSERQQPRTDHPMPTRKRQLRQPQLLDQVEKLIIQISQPTSQKIHAA